MLRQFRVWSGGFREGVLSLRQMSMKTAIVLADDHQLMRQGLRALLRSQTDFDIAGEASDGLEAVVLCRQLKPDLLLLDVAMPSLGGLEVARRLSRQSPRTRILVL